METALFRFKAKERWEGFASGKVPPQPGPGGNLVLAACRGHDGHPPDGRP